MQHSMRLWPYSHEASERPIHRDSSTNITRLYTHFFFTALLFVMFVALLKRSSLGQLKNSTILHTSISLRRHFFFSAKTHEYRQTTSDSDTGQDWNAAGGPEQASAAVHSPLSTAYNYDQASLTQLRKFRVAVSFAPKLRAESNKFSRHSRQHSPAALSPTGEDNLFVSRENKDGSIAVGVADGVGGWADAGYDSSAISREICHAIKNEFEDSPHDKVVSPKALLSSAFHAVQTSDLVEIGGTTACIGVFTQEKQLYVANLGDSWCGVFRGGKLVEETQFQTHNFNTPYQLAKIPKHILQEAEKQGKRYIIDSPNMCDEYVWNLSKDDVVVFATDGVTDNVVPQDIEIFLQDKLSQGSSLSEIASQLVSEVVKVSKDANYPSAFAQELSRLTGQRYMGGKEDDITVVMVKVL
ncbi:hypothetical protein OXX79_004288 [Metschnikowia pulcherrima]